MSKTIYLDGTETLIYTQSVIQNNYIPNTMVSLGEMEVLECVRTACMYPGQFCIMTFSSQADPYRREQLARKLLAALDLRSHHHFELRLDFQHMALAILPYKNNQQHQRNIKAEIPWTKFTP